MNSEDYQLSINTLEDAEYKPFGPRQVYRSRDLGVAEATGGTFEARILSAAEPCPGNLGLHRHLVEFQMIYILKGWAKFYLEGAGEVTVRAGTCVNIPPRIPHDMLDHSDDIEFIEIITPAQGGTVWMDPVGNEDGDG